MGGQPSIAVVFRNFIAKLDKTSGQTINLQVDWCWEPNSNKDPDWNKMTSSQKNIKKIHCSSQPFHSSLTCWKCQGTKMLRKRWEQRWRQALSTRKDMFSAHSWGAWHLIRFKGKQSFLTLAYSANIIIEQVVYSKSNRYRCLAKLGCSCPGRLSKAGSISHRSYFYSHAHIIDHLSYLHLKLHNMQKWHSKKHKDQQRC